MLAFTGFSVGKKLGYFLDFDPGNCIFRHWNLYKVVTSHICVAFRWLLWAIPSRSREVVVCKYIAPETPTRY